jgi:hypothetical protein
MISKIQNCLEIWVAKKNKKVKINIYWRTNWDKFVEVWWKIGKNWKLITKIKFTLRLLKQSGLW